MQIKTVPPSLDWSYDELLSMIPGFLEIYSRRPIQDNEGGMKAPHMFALYCFLKKLDPAVVIESGVWRGQGTWLIEQVSPNADLHCIDIDLSRRRYTSPKAKYYEQDFSSIDWDHISDKGNALLFFDDHQDAFRRIKAGGKIGFKNFIFEDNYPALRGDCYSLKKVLLHSGHTNGHPPTLLTKVKGLLGRGDGSYISPNKTHAQYLHKHLATYYEFPPVYKVDTTRWGDPWTDDKYPTPKPLTTTIADVRLRVFKEDSDSYTWMCMARLK
jgi:hypothetical protein